jgi:hypothetical protein
MREKAALPKNREGSGTHPTPGKLLPRTALYCAVNVNGVIMPQSATYSSSGKYADGKKLGYPPVYRLLLEG